MRLQPAIETASTPSVVNVHITNPIIIGNMTDSEIKTTDKSNTANVIVNGNDNLVVTNSKNTKIDNAISEKSSQHWLQIFYWVVGILVSFIAIYKFFIEQRIC